MRRSITPDYPLLTADAFLGFDFGDRKAELDNGVVRMMAGDRRGTSPSPATF